MTKTPTASEIRDLIARLDVFHGNELKDRSEASVKAEIAEIRHWLQGLRTGTVPGEREDYADGGYCSRSDEERGYVRGK